MPETPEQKARREIDADLTAAGWIVQDKDDLDLTAEARRRRARVRHEAGLWLRRLPPLC
jgi:type I site-specific restriction endonuclease